MVIFKTRCNTQSYYSKITHISVLTSNLSNSVSLLCAFYTMSCGVLFLVIWGISIGKWPAGATHVGCRLVDGLPDLGVVYNGLYFSINSVIIYIWNLLQKWNFSQLIYIKHRNSIWPNPFNEKILFYSIITFC